MKVSKSKIIINFIIILSISLYIFTQNSICQTPKRNVLVLGSYDLENEWENEVITGVKEILNSENKLNIEFLDSEKAVNENYYESLLEFLNTKYSDSEIDCIFTVDDEALVFIQDNLFREDSFCYKKPVFFVGVNGITNFTDEERLYISGVIDSENSLETVDIIKNTINDLHKIYLIIDKSEYNSTLKENISSLYLSEENIDVVTIESTYIEDLMDKIDDLESGNSAIILSGTFINKTNEKTVDSDTIISRMKSITDIPIFTTLDNYITAGAIGGVVNDGEKLGEIGATLLQRLITSYNASETFFLTPPSHSIYTAKFNFKALRQYKINPLHCPDNSVFINKPKLDFILPVQVVYTTYAAIIAVIVSIIFLIVFAIISKRNEKEAKLKYIEASTREKIKTDSLILMSHEFRTPLNIIMSTVELLLLKSKNKQMDFEYYEEKLKSISKNSSRLKKAINNAIDVAKLEIGVMDIKFEMYNIIEVIEDITDTTIDLAEKQNIEIIFDTNEEEVYTAIDKKSIERIVLNLISNAIKSIRDSGKIFVICEKKDDFIYVSVKDNGCGIDEESKKHIFEKYYQANSSYTIRESEGSGLGLYIVNGLVKLHNGEIFVDSSVGCGSVFTFKLPIVFVDTNPINYDKSTIPNEATKTEMSDI